MTGSGADSSRASSSKAAAKKCATPARPNSTFSGPSQSGSTGISMTRPTFASVQEKSPSVKPSTSNPMSFPGNSRPESANADKFLVLMDLEDSLPASLSTGFDCEECKQDFRSATHLQLHFELSAVHHVCDICKKDTDSWEALLLHYKSTSHAIVCGECCHGNGNAFPANGIAYRSHLKVQHVCMTCNLHCGSLEALYEVIRPLLWNLKIC